MGVSQYEPTHESLQLIQKKIHFTTKIISFGDKDFLMNIQATKLELIHWLTELQDQNTIEQLQAIRDQQTLNLSKAHQQLLDERIAFHEQNPDQLLDWDQVARKLEQDL